MSRLEFTDEDRAEARRIMDEALQRAKTREAALTAAERPQPQPQPTRKLTNRRRQPPQRPDGGGFGPTAGVVLGMVASLALITLVQLLWRPAAPVQHANNETTNSAAVLSVPQEAAATPSPTVEQVDAYAAPGGVLLGPIEVKQPTYRHSGAPGWAGVLHNGAVVWVRSSADLSGLPDLAPPPTPAVIYVERPVYIEVEPECDITINPRYTAMIDVYDPRGAWIGEAVGYSCRSQQEAQAHADAEAAKIREASPSAKPTPAPRECAILGRLLCGGGGEE